MNSGSEGKTGVYGHADTAFRRWVVAPLGNQEEAAAHQHGLQGLVRFGHPVPLFGLLDLAAERGKQVRAISIVFKEGAEAIGGFDDSRHAGFPEVGDE